MFCACSFHDKNNLLSNCGLVDATIGASEKDLPVNRPEQVTSYQIESKMQENVGITLKAYLRGSKGAKMDLEMG